MAERYVSIKLIMDKLLRHPMLSDLTLETVVDYTVDFMRIVGIPKMFMDKIAVIPINNYKAALPSDWVETVQIKFNNRMMRSATNTFYLDPSTDTQEQLYNSRIITDAFEVITAYLELHKNDEIGPDTPTRIEIQANSILVDGNAIETPRGNIQVGNEDATFAIQGSIIQTSVLTGNLIMAYKAIATDDEGYPLLVDNSNFTRALEFFIKKQHFSILFDLGKVTQQVMSKAEVDYAWSVGSCENDMKRMDLSKAESFFNSYRSLIIKDHMFEEGFKKLGRKENFK